MKRKKSIKRLARRNKSYEETLKGLSPKKALAYRRPGSMKGQLG